jgi:hypothetical protein
MKKFGGRHNYEEDYAKALKGLFLAHPKSNHTLENCKVLKEIYRCKLASENADKPNDATDQRNRRDDDEDNPDKNPKHQYQEPVRHVATIIGDKVFVESKRERKLLARACLNVAKVDDLIVDPRLPLVTPRNQLQQGGSMGHHPRTMSFHSCPQPLYQ